jgi:hypothetical protein
LNSFLFPGGLIVAVTNSEREAKEASPWKEASSPPIQIWLRLSFVKNAASSSRQKPLSNHGGTVRSVALWLFFIISQVIEPTEAKQKPPRTEA